MSFEWQDRDAAARTLGVDTATLQAWIDDGRAPSRTNQGRVQVLIEHIDESAEAIQAEANEQAKTNGESRSHGQGDGRAKSNGTDREAAGGADADASPRAERVQALPTDLELVSKRELQMAGGMVAAWQRLAETSNKDLVRARKVGIVSWSLVAAMVVLGGIGLWLSTHSVTQTQGRLDSTQEKLTHAEQSVIDSQARVVALQGELSQRMADLAEANAKLSATIERVSLSKTQADQLAAQHLLTKQLADKQAETSRSLADSLQATIDDQKQRLAGIEKDLAAARQETSKLATDVAATKKSNEEQAKELEARKASITRLTDERDALKKQIEQVTADHAAAMKTIDDLKKQVASLKADMERTKTAEK